MRIDKFVNASVASCSADIEVPGCEPSGMLEAECTTKASRYLLKLSLLQVSEDRHNVDQANTYTQGQQVHDLLESDYNA
jgi:hypothetical protein